MTTFSSVIKNAIDRFNEYYLHKYIKEEDIRCYKLITEVDDIYPYHREEFAKCLKESILISGYSALIYDGIYITLDKLSDYYKYDINKCELGYIHYCKDCIFTGMFCIRSYNFKDRHSFCVTRLPNVSQELESHKAEALKQFFIYATYYIYRPEYLKEKVREFFKLFGFILKKRRKQ